MDGAKVQPRTAEKMVARLHMILPIGQYSSESIEQNEMSETNRGTRLAILGAGRGD